MKLLKTQVLSGPNIWSTYRKNLIQTRIDLEEMENFPTDKLPGFNDELKKLLPGLYLHECSEGVPGGFYERLRRGTWLGHVIEHVALEMQSMAGMTAGYGRTRETEERGIYNMVFTYEVEQAGLYALQAAFNLVDALSQNKPYDITPDIDELKRLKARYGLGPSTKSIVDEAAKRGIPWKRLGQSRIQLGYGKNQKRFRATMTENTSAEAVDIAGDKDATKRLLASAYIPVAAGDICSDEDGLLQIIDEIGFPIVIKPLDGNQGKGATINITDVEKAKTAFKYAQSYSKYVLVESLFLGSDYRLLVVGGKFIAAAKRVPANVIGDGKSSVRELIELVNQDPRRGDGHESELTKIKFDEDTFHQLEKLGYTIESVPDAGEIVYLKSTANLSTGGTSTDVTDEVHPENRFMAERIAKLIGLDICGIDVMATRICRPVREVGGGVIEVNAAPGFRMHTSPSEGKPRNVGAAVVEMMYPEDAKSRIPIFAITGTNGKTTTTRVLAHIVKNAGYTPGYTTTDGIYIGDFKICEGDTTGPKSAAIILQDKSVDFAVLETARGGLLRNGLYFDKCDVGIITNIREDHLGLNDIHTLDDLRKVKSVVVQAVAEDGWAILNAEDENCVKTAKELDCNVVYFAMDSQNEIVKSHLADGKTAVVLEGKDICFMNGSEKQIIASVDQIPLTQNGRAKFMVANVLAAAAAALSYGFDKNQIASALATFVPGYELTPGRLNMFDVENFKVLVDYAHNPHGLLAVKDYIADLPAKRKIGIISGIGDRRDADIIEFAEIAGTMFDHIIIRQEHDLRGRKVDEINNLIIGGIRKVNNTAKIDAVDEEADAIVHAMNIANDGDLVVALSDQHKKVVSAIEERINKNKVIQLSHGALSESRAS
ncbi:MAG: cyanophycin synthetase [Flavobacterium sp.]|nr:MAG: cyanophycin synthetase [Flavobacterium sp.]